MQVVCEATQSTNLKIQVAALQNLVKILTLYYDYMEYYMGPALFAVKRLAIDGFGFRFSRYLDHHGRNEIYAR